MDLFHIFNLNFDWEGILKEECHIKAQNLRLQRRILRLRLNVLDWRDELFEQNFRISKPVFLLLIEELKQIRGTTYETRRAIPLDQKILVTLAFFATGSYQRITGVANNMAQQTVSKCIHEVTELMNRPQILNKWIKFPNTRAERDIIKQRFYENFEFPGVLGAIDGTHVAVIKPDKHEALYYNRKGYHSLNVMIVCDSESKIMAVNAKFGGASHDAHVWKMSLLRKYIKNINRSGESGWLLGDTGYPQRPWMMTPIEDATEGTREFRYNAKHATARCTIERCIGVLKNTWRCLLKHRVLHYDPFFSGKIVNACCTLHNISYKFNVVRHDFLLTDTDLELISNPLEENDSFDMLRQGEIIRERIVNEYC